MMPMTVAQIMRLGRDVGASGRCSTDDPSLDAAKRMSLNTPASCGAEIARVCHLASAGHIAPSDATRLVYILKRIASACGD
jgi:hypothetical protein